MNRKWLAPYLCAGYPDPSATLPLLHALSDAGADCIELGVPFSDPLADGGVIQEASARSLAAGTTLAGVLKTAEAFTSGSAAPLYLMSYVNPILRMGAVEFADRAAAAGIAGCIVPDLPPEAQDLLQAGDRTPRLVQFVAPNTPDARIAVLTGRRPPFLYCVSVFGVTGAREEVADYTVPFLRRVKAVSDIPALVGFGVSSPEQAALLAREADGVIVGSALLRALMSCADPVDLPETARRFLAPFREALDAASDPRMPESREEPSEAIKE